jgi:peroxiredoxin Q/BCP
LGALIGVAALAVSCRSGAKSEEGSGLLAIGKPVPELAGQDQAGKSHRLAELKGQRYVVFFYPKAGTPGCTKEACAFRDVWDRFEAAKIGVFGVSSDSVDALKSFADKHQLTFPLISDTSGAWARAFGVNPRLGLYERVSFLIGPDGNVARVYPQVDPGVHANEVLRDAEALR